MTSAFSHIASSTIRALALAITFAISAGCTTSTKMAKTQESQSHWPTDVKQAMIASQQETEQYTKALDSSFQKEEPDRDWSNRSINEIQGTFKSKDAAGLSIVEIQCRSTLCRIVAEGDLIQVGKVLHRSLPKLSTSFSQSLMTRVNGKGDRVNTVIYLVRQGHNLP